ncbi:MAG TPA: hypothetical protein VGL81_22665 [Polyangiaceae bacterium]
MAFADIPPYVLAGELPPNAPGWRRAFHERSFALASPIDFPRELFADVLVEHARLLEAHLEAILSAPLEEEPEHEGDDGDAFRRLDAIHQTCTLLASDGGTVEHHKWCAAGVSYVVQRCRGIVRRLIEVSDFSLTYVVVVAKGVASLHRLRCVEPKRAGDAERLEVCERDIVVEPWDQWHRRTEDAVVTWWRTPAGELVASRVVRPPQSTGDVVDALVHLYEPSLRRELEEDARETGRATMGLVDSGLGGDTIRAVGLDNVARWTKGYPGIHRAALKPMPGFYAVLVEPRDDVLGLRWLPVVPGRDVALPPGVVETRPAKPAAAPRPRGAAKAPRALRVAPVALPWKDVKAVWLLGLGALVCLLFGGECFLAVTVGPLADEVRELVVPLAALLLLPASVALVVACRRRYVDARHAAILAREARRRSGTRGRRPGTIPHAVTWRAKLAERLTRLGRLLELDAPELIIANERRLVRNAIAELSPSDAQAVLRAWPHLVPLLDAEDANAPPDEKPN